MIRFHHLLKNLFLNLPNWLLWFGYWPTRWSLEAIGFVMTAEVRFVEEPLVFAASAVESLTHGNNLNLKL